jgi:hypothetical protein
MRRVDLALIAITLLLGAVWFYLRREAPDPAGAGSVTARDPGWILSSTSE